jgi:hypothetical protein
MGIEKQNSPERIDKAHEIASKLDDILLDIDFDSDILQKAIKRMAKNSRESLIRNVHVVEKEIPLT